MERQSTPTPGDIDILGGAGVRLTGRAGSKRITPWEIVGGAVQRASGEVMPPMGTSRRGYDRAVHGLDAEIIVGGVFIGFADVEAVAVLITKRRSDDAPPHDRQHGQDKRANDAADYQSGHAAFSGRGFPRSFATNLKWAMRDDGMPIDRQLWTVETGASISLATAEVPPR